MDKAPKMASGAKLPLNESGMTVQTVILSGLLALAAIIFGAILWNVFLDQADNQPGSISSISSKSKTQ